jgi:NitT/TauT family transport system permease protein
MKHWFTPLGNLSSFHMRMMIALQIIIALAMWMVYPSTFFPKPHEIGIAWLKLMNEGFLLDIGTSLRITIEAIIITTIISLGFVYLSVFPWFRPSITLISKFRFNGLVGVTLFFTLLASGGHELKLMLMVFGTTTWFITAMSAEILAIPREQFDLAKTLGMSRLRIVYEVIILGTADKALEIMRQNTAIGWMMLTMVEGMVRSEGGVGAMLLNQSKYLRLDAVFAIQITVLIIGIMIDEILGLVKNFACPYTNLNKEKLK